MCCWVWRLCHTIQHRAVLIIFPLNLQTTNITRMLSSGGEWCCSITEAKSRYVKVLDCSRTSCNHHTSPTSHLLLTTQPSTPVTGQCYQQLTQLWPRVRVWVLAGSDIDAPARRVPPQHRRSIQTSRQTSEYGTQVVMTWRMWANISHVGGMWVLDGLLFPIWEEYGSTVGGSIRTRPYGTHMGQISAYI